VIRSSQSAVAQGLRVKGQGSRLTFNPFRRVLALRSVRSRRAGLRVKGEPLTLTLIPFGRVLALGSVRNDSLKRIGRRDVLRVNGALQLLMNRHG